MSSRPDGQPRRHALTPEDDWFSSPSPRRDDWLVPEDDAPFDREEPVWHAADDDDDGYGDGYEEPRSAVHALGDRRWMPIVAAAGIVAVIVVAIVVVRSLGGTDSGASATTAQLTDTTAIDTTAVETTTTDTTATTTPAATTPATTTPATTTPATTVSAVPAGQSLKPGMSGSSVLALQQALAQLGYDPGTPDGSYGPSTTQAVTAFQQANSLTADGIAGPATLAAVNAQLARG